MTVYMPPLNAFPCSRLDQAKAAIFEMPLSTRAEVEKCLGLSEGALKGHWAELKRAREIETYGLGYTLRNSQRARLLPGPAMVVGSGSAGWSTDPAVTALFEHLPLVEHAYRVARSFSEPSGLFAFQWILGDAICAAARISSTKWIAICWSGPQESEHDLGKKLVSLHADLRRYGVSAMDPTIPYEDAFPSLVVFVVLDAWQGELVRRAAYRAGMQDLVEVYLASDPWSADERRPVGAARGWLHAMPPLRDMGNWPLEKRIASSLAARPNGRTLFRIRDLLYQFGGVGFTNLGKLSGDANRTQIDAALDVLAKMKMARSVDLKRAQSESDRKKALKSGGLVVRQDGSAAVRDIRYGITNPAVREIALRDGHNFSRGLKTSRALSWDLPEYANQRTHEDTLLRAMAGFGNAKLEIAAGPRCDDNFLHGGINPDGLIYINGSPFGEGWHYLEIERRARSERGLENKFKSYLSPNRLRYFPGPQSPPPVLFMCRNERLEALAHQIAKGFPVLTITNGRWRRYGPLGGWQLFGEQVRLS